MRSSLWSDVDAMARLAHSRHAAEFEMGGAGAEPIVFPSGSSPAFPDRKELDIHACGSPARLVTGDSFDYFFVSEETLAVTVADVSGKGIPAALLMEVTRSMVRNLSSVSASPTETLTRVNRILHQADLGAMYVTIFLGWYNTRTGAMRYVNAGHPPPYRLGGDGRVEPFGRVTGPILGILGVEKYDEEADRLEVGERLVLYTDGVTEAESPEGEFFGPERLEALLAKYASVSVHRLCDLVASAIRKFQAGRCSDDATLLALQRNA